jgi:hypothetical protein
MVGGIGAFAMVAVQIAMLLLLFGVGSQAIMYAVAILGLGSFIGMGVGFLGYQKHTGNGLAMGVAILFFLMALLAVLPVIARSRAMLPVIVYVVPILGFITWTLTGIIGLGAERVFGGTAKIIGITMLVAGIWQVISLVVTLSARSMGAMNAMRYASIAIILVHMVGLILLGLGFMKSREARA